MQKAWCWLKFIVYNVPNFIWREYVATSMWNFLAKFDFIYQPKAVLASKLRCKPDYFDLLIVIIKISITITVW